MIPEEIKQHPYWCVRDEKKLPYNPKTRRLAKPDNPATFGTYEEAVAIVDQYAGLGVLLGATLEAVDIDHCITDGQPSKMAKDIIEQFHSYTEVSPSGTGIRILFHSNGTPYSYDKKRYYFKNTSKGIEFYPSGMSNRYVTVTGNTLPDSPGIRVVSQSEIDDFAEQYMRLHEDTGAIDWDDPIGGKASIEKGMESLDAASIIEKARAAKNGSKFDALYNGDISGYPSQSEADQAFCNMLAFWCGQDYSLIDSIFRQSGLYRDKWDENRGGRTYGQITIERAVSGCIETYKQKRADHVCVESPNEWEEPIPLDDDPLPPFPVGCLPPVIGNYIRSVSEAMQVPEDMAAVAALVSVAICVQKKFMIKGKADWLEPLNLYGLIVAPPAERKSAVMQAMTKPIHVYEKRVNDFNREEIETSTMKKRLLEKTVASLETAAAKVPTAKEKKRVTEEDVLKAQKELSELEEMKPLRLLADDCTPEVLISLLAENNGRMALTSAEGGIFEIMNGRYSQSMNIDVFLKAHAGDPIRIDRKGRPSEYVPHPALCMLLAVQPVILNGLMSNKDFRGRGLTARFLYCIPQSHVGHRSFETTPIPRDSEEQFRTMINTLLDIEQGVKPKIINLSDEAYRVSADFATELEPRLIGDLEPIGDWAGKLHGAILRIAAALHLVETREDGADTPLSLETMCSAIEIGRYFLEHAKKAYKIMGADEQLQGAKVILRTAEKLQIRKPISKRDLYRDCRGSIFQKAADMEAPIVYLCEAGYMREIVINSSGSGRKPSPLFEFNPVIYKESS